MTKTKKRTLLIALCAILALFMICGTVATISPVQSDAFADDTTDYIAATETLKDTLATYTGTPADLNDWIRSKVATDTDFGNAFYKAYTLKKTFTPENVPAANQDAYDKVYAVCKDAADLIMKDKSYRKYFATYQINAEIASIDLLPDVKDAVKTYLGLNEDIVIDANLATYINYMTETVSAPDEFYNSADTTKIHYFVLDCEATEADGGFGLTPKTNEEYDYGFDTTKLLYDILRTIEENIKNIKEAIDNVMVFDKYSGKVGGKNYGALVSIATVANPDPAKHTGEIVLASKASLDEVDNGIKAVYGLTYAKVLEGVANNDKACKEKYALIKAQLGNNAAGNCYIDVYQSYLDTYNAIEEQPSRIALRTEIADVKYKIHNKRNAAGDEIGLNKEFDKNIAFVFRDEITHLKDVSYKGVFCTDDLWSDKYVEYNGLDYNEEYNVANGVWSGDDYNKIVIADNGWRLVVKNVNPTGKQISEVIACTLQWYVRIIEAEKLYATVVEYGISPTRSDEQNYVGILENALIAWEQLTLVKEMNDLREAARKLIAMDSDDEYFYALLEPVYKKYTELLAVQYAIIKRDGSLCTAEYDLLTVDEKAVFDRDKALDYNFDLEKLDDDDLKDVMVITNLGDLTKRIIEGKENPEVLKPYEFKIGYLLEYYIEDTTIQGYYNTGVCITTLHTRATEYQKKVTATTEKIKTVSDTVKADGKFYLDTDHNHYTLMKLAIDSYEALSPVCKRWVRNNNDLLDVIKKYIKAKNQLDATYGVFQTMLDFGNPDLTIEYLGQYFVKENDNFGKNDDANYSLYVTKDGDGKFTVQEGVFTAADKKYKELVSDPKFILEGSKLPSGTLYIAPFKYTLFEGNVFDNKNVTYYTYEGVDEDGLDVYVISVGKAKRFYFYDAGINGYVMATEDNWDTYVEWDDVKNCYKEAICYVYNTRKSRYERSTETVTKSMMVYYTKEIETEDVDYSHIKENYEAKLADVNELIRKTNETIALLEKLAYRPLSVDEYDYFKAQTLEANDMYNAITTTDVKETYDYTEKTGFIDGAKEVIDLLDIPDNYNDISGKLNTNLVDALIYLTDDMLPVVFKLNELLDQNDPMDNVGNIQAVVLTEKVMDYLKNAEDAIAQLNTSANGRTLLAKALYQTRYDFVQATREEFDARKDYADAWIAKANEAILTGTVSEGANNSSYTIYASTDYLNNINKLITIDLDVLQELFEEYDVMPTDMKLYINGMTTEFDTVIKNTNIVYDTHYSNFYYEEIKNDSDGHMYYKLVPIETKPTDWDYNEKYFTPNEYTLNTNAVWDDTVRYYTNVMGYEVVSVAYRLNDNMVWSADTKYYTYSGTEYVLVTGGSQPEDWTTKALTAYYVNEPADWATKALTDYYVASEFSNVNAVWSATGDYYKVVAGNYVPVEIGVQPADWNENTKALTKYYVLDNRHLNTSTVDFKDDVEYMYHEYVNDRFGQERYKEEKYSVAGVIPEDWYRNISFYVAKTYSLNTISIWDSDTRYFTFDGTDYAPTAKGTKPTDWETKALTDYYVVSEYELANEDWDATKQYYYYDNIEHAIVEQEIGVAAGWYYCVGSRHYGSYSKIFKLNTEAFDSTTYYYVKKGSTYDLVPTGLSQEPADWFDNSKYVTPVAYKLNTDSVWDANNRYYTKSGLNYVLLETTYRLNDNAVWNDEITYYTKSGENYFPVTPDYSLNTNPTWSADIKYYTKSGAVYNLVTGTEEPVDWATKALTDYYVKIPTDWATNALTAYYVNIPADWATKALTDYYVADKFIPAVEWEATGDYYYYDETDSKYVAVTIGTQPLDWDSFRYSLTKYYVADVYVGGYGLGYNFCEETAFTQIDEKPADWDTYYKYYRVNGFALGADFDPDKVDIYSYNADTKQYEVVTEFDNYADYYYIQDSQYYRNCKSSIWSANTFYQEVDGEYVLLTEKPENWDNYFDVSKYYAVRSDGMRKNDIWNTDYSEYYVVNHIVDALKILRAHGEQLALEVKKGMKEIADKDATDTLTFKDYDVAVRLYDRYNHEFTKSQKDIVDLKKSPLSDEETIEITYNKITTDHYVYITMYTGDTVINTYRYIANGADDVVEKFEKAYDKLCFAANFRKSVYELSDEAFEATYTLVQPTKDTSNTYKADTLYFIKDGANYILCSEQPANQGDYNTLVAKYTTLYYLTYVEDQMYFGINGIDAEYDATFKAATAFDADAVYYIKDNKGVYRLCETQPADETAFTSLLATNAGKLFTRKDWKTQVSYCPAFEAYDFETFKYNFGKYGFIYYTREKGDEREALSVEVYVEALALDCIYRSASDVYKAFINKVWVDELEEVLAVHDTVPEYGIVDVLNALADVSARLQITEENVRVLYDSLKAFNDEYDAFIIEYNTKMDDLDGIDTELKAEDTAIWTEVKKMIGAESMLSLTKDSDAIMSLKTLTETLAQLRSEFDTLEDEFDAFVVTTGNNFDKEKGLREAADTKIESEYKAAIQALKTGTVATGIKNLKQLTDDLADDVADLAQLRTEFDTLKSAYDTFVTETGAKFDTEKDLREVADAKIDSEYKAAIQALKDNEIKKLTDDLADDVADLAQLRTEFDALKSAYDTFKALVESDYDTIENVDKKIGDAILALKTNEIADVDAQVSLLEGKLTTLTTRVEALETAKEKAVADIADLYSTTDSLDIAVKAEETARISADALLSKAIDNAVADLDKDILAINQTLDKAVTDLAQLKSDFYTLKEDYDAFKVDEVAAREAGDKAFLEAFQTADKELKLDIDAVEARLNSIAATYITEAAAKKAIEESAQSVKDNEIATLTNNLSELKTSFMILLGFFCAVVAGLIVFFVFYFIQKFPKKK